MLAAILGAFRAGLVAVPVSTMQTGAELGAVLADSGARLVVVHPRAGRGRAGGAPGGAGGRARRAHGDAAARRTAVGDAASWDDFLDAGRAATDLREPVPTDEDSWALWLYTSGTTGTAQGGHAPARQHPPRLPRRTARRCWGSGPTTSRSRSPSCSSPTGSATRCSSRFVVGATRPARPAAAHAADGPERLPRTGPRSSSRSRRSTPRLLASDCRTTRSRPVRLAASAGEPLPGPLLGGSRTGSASTSSTASARPRRCTSSCPTDPATSGPGTTGTPVPGYDVVVRDDDGRGGRRRGAGCAARARRVDRAGLLAPYRRHPAGVPGRVAGHRRHLRARRGRLLHLPRPQLRHAQGRRHLGVARRGREPADRAPRWCARRRWSGWPTSTASTSRSAVVVADGVTEAELVAWCRDGMAHYKAPRRVLFVDDLPKTATGKLQRFKVRGSSPTVRTGRRRRPARSHP